MSAKLIDGKSVAQEVEDEVRRDIERLTAGGLRPGLTVIRVGSDPASEVYVRSKERKARELGIHGVERHLPEETTQEELSAEIDRLNEDDSVDGILLQLPVPSHLDADPLINRIAPAKDVDGFHPVNVGRLSIGQPCLVPCTPAGALRLIESTGEPIKGKNAVVVGRSNIVGKPVAALLLQRHATVTICHSRTADLRDEVRRADIVIAAVGRPLMVEGDWIKPGAFVIDVGINRVEPSSDVVSKLSDSKRARLEDKGSVLVGDVDFPSAAEVAGWITPVPGGVGPMTIAMLMKNTVQAAGARRG